MATKIPEPSHPKVTGEASESNYGQYVIEFACGHSGRKEFYGGKKRRQSSLDYWTERTCVDCWKAEQNRVADEIEEGLPELEGSERQIAWARTIRAKFIQQARANLPEALERVATIRTEMEEEIGVDATAEYGWENALKGERDRHASLEQRTSAKWWIDNRDKDILDILTIK